MYRIVLASDKWFYFVGGKTARTLEELRDSLEQISNEEFVFHVNGAKNDFANWIEGVFNQRDLARELRHVMERKDTIQIINRHIKEHTRSSVADHASYPKASNISTQGSVEVRKPSEEKLIAGPAHEVELPVKKSALELPPPNKQEDAVKAGEEPNKVKDQSEDKSPAPESLEENPEEIRIDHASKERDLTREELEDFADDVKFDMKMELHEMQVRRRIDKEYKKYADQDDRFIVKEFIYGFILGLIFGLIMLGTLLNLNIYY